MPPQIALLRGINLGTHNRVPMPELREHLSGLGYGDVRTLIASGNIVLDAPARGLAKDLRAAIADRFGVDTPVIVRSAKQLAKVVDDNPFPGAGGKALHVLFLEEKCPAAAAAALGEVDGAVVAGREVYCHYGDAMIGSPLAKALAKHLPKTGTDRNWNTVLRLLEMTR